MKTAKEIYEQELDNQKEVPERVKKLYKIIQDDIYDYAAAIEEYAFIWGYEAARRELRNEKQ